MACCWDTPDVTKIIWIFSPVICDMRWCQILLFLPLKSSHSLQIYTYSSICRVLQEPGGSWPCSTTMELSSRGNDGRSSSSKGKESTLWLGFEEPSHPYATPGSSDGLTVKCHALVPLGGGCMGKFPDARLQGTDSWALLCNH